MSEESDETPESTEGSDASTTVAVMDRPGELAEVREQELARVELRKDRVWLPFLIPVGAILAVALFAINLSRLFLAASEGGKSPAVVIATVITLAILIGATIVAAIPNLRTSSLVLTVCGIAAAVSLAGSLVLGAGESKEEAVAEPQGEAINTLEVDAQANLKFQATNFDAPAGVNLIKYVDKGGSHTLLFVESEFSYVNLVVPGGPFESKVDLVKGKKYTIYCSVPGHRQAGMEATITVGDAPTTPTPEAGTATPTTVIPGATPSTAPSGASEVDPAAQSGNELGN